MKLKSVTECTEGHCSFHFPQFVRCDFAKWKLRLLEVVQEGNSPDRDVFSEAIKLIDDGKFVEAAELAGEKYGYQFYLSLRGEPILFHPCCH